MNPKDITLKDFINDAAEAVSISPKQKLAVKGTIAAALALLMVKLNVESPEKQDKELHLLDETLMDIKNETLAAMGKDKGGSNDDTNTNKHSQEQVQEQALKAVNIVAQAMDKAKNPNG